MNIFITILVYITGPLWFIIGAYKHLVFSGGQGLFYYTALLATTLALGLFPPVPSEIVLWAVSLTLLLPIYSYLFSLGKVVRGKPLKIFPSEEEMEEKLFREKLSSLTVPGADISVDPKSGRFNLGLQLSPTAMGEVAGMAIEM